MVDQSIIDHLKLLDQQLKRLESKGRKGGSAYKKLKADRDRIRSEYVGQKGIPRGSYGDRFKSGLRNSIKGKPATPSDVRTARKIMHGAQYGGLGAIVGGSLYQTRAFNKEADTTKEKQYGTASNKRRRKIRTGMTVSGVGVGAVAGSYVAGMTHRGSTPAGMIFGTTLGTLAVGIPSYTAARSQYKNNSTADKEWKVLQRNRYTKGVEIKTIKNPRLRKEYVTYRRNGKTIRRKNPRRKEGRR